MVSLTDAQLMELWDKQALHDNIMLYVRAADRHDRELMSTTYWEDSWDDHSIYVGPGQGWVDAAVSYRDGMSYSCSHHLSNVHSEIDGNRAKRESMFICVVAYKDPEVSMFQAGRYRDLCEKRDGEWRILHRTCVWDWMDVRPLNADFETVGVPRVSHWGDWKPEDPIYKDWVESRPTEYSRPGSARFSS